MKKHATYFSRHWLNVIAFVFILGVSGGAAHTAYAGVITLNFDDGNSSQYDIAVPLLNAAAQKGVFFINSGLLGTEEYMTWSQVKALNDGGHEIAAHTLTHAELPTLTKSEINREVNQDFANFVAQGITPVDFALPFGAYDNYVLATAAKKYNSIRAFANQGLNFWPYNKYVLYVHYVTNQTSVAQATAWVDEAMAQDAWLVLVFHEILPVVDPTDDYSWETTKFSDFLSYLNSKQIKAKTIQQALVQNANLISNPSFESGLSGWTTSAPLRITVNTTNNGSYPAPKNSLRIRGGSAAAHVFGQKVPVLFGTTYGFRVYTDSRNYTSGEFGFYLDEYDQNGAWISGKWLGGIFNKNVVDKSYVYTPTSSAVKTAAVQVYVTPGTEGSVILDNIELFPR